MRYYPVFLDLAGQPCVVIGGGQLAEEKAAALRDAGATVRVIRSSDYRAGDLTGARLVVDASDDPEINRRSWQEAEHAGILINVVDRPAQCRFIAPAIVRRDPLLIAISTSGESPYLASALRARLERWLGQEWTTLTLLFGAVRRRLRSRGMPIAEQTRIYERLMHSEVLDLLRTRRCDEAASLTARLARPYHMTVGSVALVGAGPGDAGLITVRGRDLLARADFVLHDTLVSEQTLALCGPEAQLEAVGKRAGRDNSTPQGEITKRLIELARTGHFVVRLKGGDPFVFGRGGEELRDLVDAGIDVEVVPGITSGLAAAASIGVPATMRGMASSVAITAAQGACSLERIEELARTADTLVVLMALSNLREVTAVIAGAVGGLRAAAVVSKATLGEQRSVSGPIGDIARLAEEAALESPATLIVGEVVRLGCAHASLYI